MILKALTGALMLLFFATTVVKAANEYYTAKTNIYLAEEVHMSFKAINFRDFQIELTMPLDHYVALSFGGTHVEADMIVFVTSASLQHSVFDMYSTTWGQPELDTSDDLAWIDSDTAYPLIKFTVTREYDTGDAQDYVLQLGEVTRMGFAIRNSELLEETSTGVGEFGGHTRHGFFDMIVSLSGETSYWPVYVNGATTTASVVLGMTASAIALLIF